MSALLQNYRKHGKSILNAGLLLVSEFEAQAHSNIKWIETVKFNMDSNKWSENINIFVKEGIKTIHYRGQTISNSSLIYHTGKGR